MSFILIFLLGIIANLAMGQNASKTSYSTPTSSTEKETTIQSARTDVTFGLNVRNLYPHEVDNDNHGFDVANGLKKLADLDEAETLLGDAKNSCAQL